MKKDLLVYLEDIMDAMNKAEMFVAGMTFEQFDADLKIQLDVDET